MTIHVNNSIGSSQNFVRIMETMIIQYIPIRDLTNASLPLKQHWSTGITRRNKWVLMMDILLELSVWIYTGFHNLITPLWFWDNMAGNELPKQPRFGNIISQMRYVTALIKWQINIDLLRYIYLITCENWSIHQHKRNARRAFYNKPVLKDIPALYITWKRSCAFVLWWRHRIETFSALLALCVGKSPVTGEFPAQRPVTRRFDIFFDLCLNKQLNKQLRPRWVETPSRSLWRQWNDTYHQCM